MPPPASEVWHRGIAIVAVLLLGANLPIKSALTLQPFVLLLPIWPVLLLLPVWAPAIGRYRFARPLMAVVVLAVVWGLTLSWLATDHQVNSHQQIVAPVSLITAFGAVAVLLWACDLLRPETVAILFAVGLAASHALDHAGWAANPWKYGFALPVAVGALALAGRNRSALAGILVLTGLGLVSVFSDYRSFAGFCLITILVLTWQVASRSSHARVHKAAPLLMLGAVGAGVYFMLSKLLVGGYLGTGLQQRSAAQIETSGSLLLGGRPEWAATARLMAERPQGFGFGVLPNAVDVNHGDAGLISVNIDPANGYESYMFGDAFRLHSITADLWTATGWAGLLLAAVVLLILVQKLAAELTQHTATPLLVFSAVFAIWALAFSPIFTDLKDITLAVFVALSAQSKQLEFPRFGRHRKPIPIMIADYG